MRQFLKTWMLPISIIGGIIFHEWIGYVKFLSPYLIFLMLLVTYTRIDLKEIRITRFQILLLLVQLAGCWLTYAAIAPFSQTIAAGGFICVFISTATAAPVITGMLGGSITKLISYSLLSNLTFAIFAPLFLSAISGKEITFIDSFMLILREMVPLLLAPLLLALLMRWLTPNLRKNIAEHQSISFYLWAVSLFIVVGNSVSFAIKNGDGNITEMGYLAIVALITCCAQFYVGRKIGGIFGDRISGAQGLGQKNTVIAIWVAMTYLNPITSIAPAAYVLWQNSINSAQLYIKAKHGKI